MAEAVVLVQAGQRGLIAIEADFVALQKELEPIASKRLEPALKKAIRRELAKPTKYPRKTNRGAPRTTGRRRHGEFAGTSLENKVYSEVLLSGTGTSSGGASGEAIKVQQVPQLIAGSRARTHDGEIPLLTLLEAGRSGAGRIRRRVAFWGRENKRVGTRIFEHVSLPPRPIISKAVDPETLQATKADVARAIRRGLDRNWVRPSTYKYIVRMQLRA